MSVSTRFSLTPFDLAVITLILLNFVKNYSLSKESRLQTEIDDAKTGKVSQE